jgi:hypothetical protein
MPEPGLEFDQRHRLIGVTEVLGSERLTGATLDRLANRCWIIETKVESYRLSDVKARRRPAKTAGTGATQTGDGQAAEPVDGAPADRHWSPSYRFRPARAAGFGQRSHQDSTAVYN